MELENKIREKLKEVIDPEIGADIVNLGFIYDINTKGKEAEIEMTFTSPSCPRREVVKEDVRERVKELKEIDEVRLNVVFEPPWTPDKMSEKAKKQLGFRWNE